MSGTNSSSHEVRGSAPAPRAGWAWHPPLPLEPVPVFVWPPRPLVALRYLLSRAFLGSVLLPFGALAAVTRLPTRGADDPEHRVQRWIAFSRKRLVEALAR